MALTKEDLQAIQGLLEPINKRLDGMESKQEMMDGKLEMMDGKLAIIQGDIEQIKEDTAITRKTTNALVAWADEVAVISQIRFPVKKAK